MTRALLLAAALALGACAQAPVEDIDRPYHQQFIEFYQDL